MDRKLKLAKLITLETDALETADTVQDMLTLSQEIIRDAKALAELVQEEEKKIS